MPMPNRAGRPAPEPASSRKVEPDPAFSAIGIACIVASAAAFGAMAILARAAYASGVDTATLLALRFSIAAAAMVAIALARGARLPRGSTFGALVLLGAAGYGGQAYSFFTALTLAPAGIVALLLYLHPALVALLAAAWLGERLTTVKLVALAIALAGTALTVAPAVSASGAGSGEGIVAGIGFALAAAAFYSLYIVGGAWLGRRVAALPMSTVVIASAAAVFVAAALLRGPRWPQTPEGWLAVLAIALVSTVAAITLYFAGLARVGPVRASTLSTLEPLVTVALAAALLGEAIAPAQVAGGALILGAVVLLARARNG
jgi:drug/metabolite transporter (DMT)-like permease